MKDEGEKEFVFVKLGHFSFGVSKVGKESFDQVESAKVWWMLVSTSIAREDDEMDDGSGLTMTRSCF